MFCFGVWNSSAICCCVSQTVSPSNPTSIFSFPSSVFRLVNEKLSTRRRRCLGIFAHAFWFPSHSSASTGHSSQGAADSDPPCPWKAHVPSQTAFPWPPHGQGDRISPLLVQWLSSFFSKARLRHHMRNSSRHSIATPDQAPVFLLLPMGEGRGEGS